MLPLDVLGMTLALAMHLSSTLSILNLLYLLLKIL
jgi:hypothetical protein